MGMKTILFIGICCLFNFYSFSQDTLYFKNAGKSIVIVKEVSQKEIQYKKIEMPDGPMYIVNKSDIEKIVYKNGFSEIIKPSSEQAPVSGDKPFAVTYEGPAVNLEKITYNDTKKRYYHLVNLVNTHPDPKRKNALMEQAINLKSLKKKQDGTRTCAIIFGGVAIAGTALYGVVYSASGTNSDLQIFAGPPLIFGAAAVILGSASIAINMNLKKKRQAFVDYYNQ